MQKSEMDADPPWGDGERARKSLLKKDFILLLLVTISEMKYQKPLGPYTG